ncbi:unnamed protein product, partial [Polarella glacialis]
MTGKPLVEFRNITSTVLGGVTGFEDEVTCVAVHSGLVVVGTRNGSIYQVDHAPSTRVRKIATNCSHVHALSLDVQGRFCASGTADGRVTVWSLWPGVEPWVCEHSSEPVLSVSLCPDYASNASENLAVCAGGSDGRLVLHRR